MQSLLDSLDIFEDTRIGKWWKHIFINLADARTNNWPLIRNPLPVLFILFGYWYTVRHLGPRLMANRKPFEMQKILLVYNFIQIIFSAILIYECTVHLYFFGGYSFRCQPIVRTRTPQAMRNAKAFYGYFLIKITELLDTVFFVLRKKQNQVSFLHLYHHTGMVMLTWVGAKYLPGGHFAFIGYINSIVHLIMYTYYLISALGPEWQKYLWWKKYITTIQMTQMILVVFHGAQLLYIDCGYPIWPLYSVVPNSFVVFFMFREFYVNTYKPKMDKLKIKENGHRCENGNINGFKNLMNQSNNVQNGKKLN